MEVDATTTSRRIPPCATFDRSSRQLLALGLAVSAAGTVTAKSQAATLTLDDPLPVDALPGSEVEIAWTLGVIDPNGATQPFSAEGIFIRLAPASGTPVEVAARQDRPGHYVASVTVPPGGLGAVVIGLQGTYCLENGGCSRADEIFMTAKAGSRGGVLPIDPAAEPPAVAQPAPAGQPAPTPASATPLPTPTVAPDPAVLILALLAGMSVLGAVLIRRRSGTATA